MHLRLFPDVQAEWQDQTLGAKWEKIRRARRVITGALEVERREKRIGSSLEAAPKVYVDEADAFLLRAIDGAELCITSGLEVIVGEPPANAFMLEDTPGIGVVPTRAGGQKCQHIIKILSA